MTYEVIKSLHIIAVVCWFAGLFYLPRLFVYHAQLEKQQGARHEMLKTMEFRLYRYIMSPAMTLTWVFGLWMLYLIPEWLQSGWMHAKLTFVVLLTGYNHVCSAYLKKFARGKNVKSHKFFRIFNEIPTVILIVVVFLVVLKPF